MHAEEDFRTALDILYLLGENTLAHDMIYVAHDVIYVAHDVSQF